MPVSCTTCPSWIEQGWKVGGSVLHYFPQQRNLKKASSPISTMRKGNIVKHAIAHKDAAWKLIFHGIKQVT